MLLFPFYAALFWYLAGKYRRTWKGVGIIFAGMAVLVTIEMMLIKLGMLGIAGMEPWDVIRLLIPFGVLVIVVAIFIFFLPLAPPPFVHCRACRYDLTGLEAADLCCPECGTPWTFPRRCPHCRHELPAPPPIIVACPECRSLLVPQALVPADPRPLPASSAQETPPGPDQQDDHREPEDEHPADEPQRPLAQVGDERH
jgi:hypothetical protein